MSQHFKTYLQQHTTITDEQFEKLGAELVLRSYEKGQVLIKPGDRSGIGYFVSSGLLRSYIIDQKCREHILQFAPENWWITDRDMMYFNEPSSMYIDVVEDAEVVIMKRNFLERSQEICPDFVRFNTYLLHNSIRFMQKRIGLLLAATAEERYLDFIQLYPNLLLRVPQMMVASYLGITPESLSRVRRDLARKHREQ